MSDILPLWALIFAWFLATWDWPVDQEFEVLWLGHQNCFVVQLTAMPSFEAAREGADVVVRVIRFERVQH